MRNVERSVRNVKRLLRNLERLVHNRILFRAGTPTTIHPDQACGLIGRIMTRLVWLYHH